LNAGNSSTPYRSVPWSSHHLKSALSGGDASRRVLICLCWITKNHHKLNVTPTIKIAVLRYKKILLGYNLTKEPNHFRGNQYLCRGLNAGSGNDRYQSQFQWFLSYQLNFRPFLSYSNRKKFLRSHFSTIGKKRRHFKADSYYFDQYSSLTWTLFRPF